MGIVKTKDDSNNNQLYQNIDLMVPDIQFIEKNESLYDIQSIYDQNYLLDMYNKLTWKQAAYGKI